MSDCGSPANVGSMEGLGVSVIQGGPYPGKGWLSINCHWWDGPHGIGIAVRGTRGGDIDVWATGFDFADAVANAIRYVEAKGHSVDNVCLNM